jgi:UDP-N-acetylglucosamine acyltransferase
MIHPSAIVHSDAKLDPTATVGPYAIIEAGVTLGKGSTVAAHCIVSRGTHVGENVYLGSFSVIGGLPQDLSFDTTLPSGVRIGNDTVIREHVTIHRATHEGEETIIGEKCYLMNASHVAHDCILGRGVRLTNNVLLGGHVHVGDFANLGGGASVHQGVRVGGYTMVGAFSIATIDVPPYTLCADRNRLRGLNLIGLRRHGFSDAVVSDLKTCFREFYLRDGSFFERLASLSPKTEEGAAFLAFIRAGKPGKIMRPQTQWR